MARVRARCGEGGGSSVNPVRRGRMVRSETRTGSLMGLGGVRRRSRGKSPECRSAPTHGRGEAACTIGGGRCLALAGGSAERKRQLVRYHQAGRGRAPGQGYKPRRRRVETSDGGDRWVGVWPRQPPKRRHGPFSHLSTRRRRPRPCPRRRPSSRTARGVLLCCCTMYLQHLQPNFCERAFSDRPRTSDVGS